MPMGLLLLAVLSGQASLTGTWTLDRVRSDFGRAAAPRQFVLYIEQAGDHVSATIFDADADSQRVSYQECRIEGELSRSLTCLDGTHETWQVTGANELTITRFIPTRSQAVRQRLVLERATLLDY